MLRLCRQSATESVFTPSNTDLTRCVYPLTLPFHLPLAVTRRYLEHLGTTYYDLLHTN